VSKEPENIVLRRLGEIRTKLDENTRVLNEHTGRFDRLEKRLDSLSKVVTYSLGQTTETQFSQSQQEARIDELFDKLEQLLSGKQPV
jgi:septal ring factor EnvC (AmiA/AmiB activator)